MPKCVVLKGDATKGDLVVYWCPGCKERHNVRVQKSAGIASPSWNWNGSVDKPTFQPSVHYTPGRCHHYVEEGQIRFLADCVHDLKGTTVEMVEVDDDGYVLEHGMKVPDDVADAIVENQPHVPKPNLLDRNVQHSIDNATWPDEERKA